MSENLTSRTFAGLKWSYISVAVNSVFQIGLTAILARLLDPATFGLVAMAGIVLRFGGYFAQMGVGSALIQKEKLTETDIRAAFTSSVLLGAMFSGLTYFLAPFALYIFDSAAVVPVIQVMGISFTLNGFSTTALSLLRRRLNFRWISIIEVLSYVIGYGLGGVILALSDFGVWSLVIAGLTQAALTVVLALLYERHALLPYWHPGTHKELISFGGRISIISFLEFIGFNVDTIVIGRVWGATVLGVYSRSFAIVNLPVQYLAVTFSKVLFPSFAQTQKYPDRLGNAYYVGMMLISVVAMPVSFGMIPAAPELVLTLLGSQWVEGIILLQILAVMVPFTMATILPGIICDSTGKLKAKFYLQLGFVVSMIGLIAGLYSFGIEVIAGTVVAANIARFVAYQVLMRRMNVSTYGSMLQSQVPGILVSLCVILPVVCMRWLFQGLPVVSLLVLEIIAGASMFASFVLVKPPRMLRDVVREIIPRLASDSQESLAGKLLQWYGKRVLYI